MAYTADSVKEDFVQPHRYKDMLLTLKDNVPNIRYLEGKNTVEVKKKDMVFEVTHPEEMKELMMAYKANQI